MPPPSLGFVGIKLDNYRGQSRWDKWRPSIALTQHQDLGIARFELLCNGPFEKLVEQLAADIGSVSPDTQVVPHTLEMRDAWDCEEVYGALFDFAKRYPFAPDNEDYWIHITTGTHVAQICRFLMTEGRFFPGRLVQTSPPRAPETGTSGSYALIDLDLSRYDQIAQRFSREQMEGVAFLK